RHRFCAIVRAQQRRRPSGVKDALRRSARWLQERQHSSDGGPSRSLNPGGMTRIGFAYNQKPAVSEGPEVEPSDDPREDDEPPSTRRDVQSRNIVSPVSETARPAAPVDRFAEWDAPETIDAVAAALAPLRKV